MKIVDRILNLVKDRELTSVEIAKRLKIPKGNCQVYLNTLYKQGRIIRTTNKKPYKYRITKNAKATSIGNMTLIEKQKALMMRDVISMKTEIKKQKALIVHDVILMKKEIKKLKAAKLRLEKLMLKPIHIKNTKWMKDTKTQIDGIDKLILKMYKRIEKMKKLQIEIDVLI